ncbi:MAG: glutamate formimidoyltransferase [Oscillospiraceae bacterium]|nr:glutamate formimidoyltransferase [Oscillospiraceae bacterium]
MARIIECVPNCSEGRNKEVIEYIADAVRAVPGVVITDYSSDESHNRSVFTIVGDPDQMAEAAFQFAKACVEKIDMTKHEGAHPRMGAVDVIPFTPVKEVSMEECVELSKKVAERIWTELGMPVTLYEESCTAPHRRNLAAIRKGQFEAMPEKLKDPQWHPDYGNQEIHPTAGIVAVGARFPLVAFNINLSTSDIEIANKIAKTIRESSGGMKWIKAIGVMLEDRNIAQVSINMINYTKTPMYRVFENVRFEAERYGVHIVGSEVIGVVPMDAMVDAAEYYLKVENFDKDSQIMEKHLI